MRMLLAALLSLITVSLFHPSAKAGEYDKKYPIDVEYEKESDKNPSTAGMVQAAEDAKEKWDKQMNATYKKLLAKMKPEDREALKQAQRAWLAYRDAEEESAGKIYGEMDGTMYRPMAADAIMEITRLRAVVLKGYLDVLEDNN